MVDVVLVDVVDELVDDDGAVVDGYCELLGVDDGVDEGVEDGLDWSVELVCANAPQDTPAAQRNAMSLVR